MDMDPTITVIIPEVKKERDLIRCLESIRHQTFSDYEILVCTDAVQPPSGYPRTRTCSMHGREPFAALLSQAAGAYLYFVSATAVLTENVLEALYTAEEAAQDAAMPQPAEAARDAAMSQTTVQDAAIPETAAQNPAAPVCMYRKAAVPVLGRDRDRFSELCSAGLGLYCCLWKREELSSFQESASLRPQDFLPFLQVHTLRDAQVYETDPVGAFAPGMLEPEPLAQWMELLGRIISAGMQSDMHSMRDPAHRQASPKASAPQKASASPEAARISGGPYRMASGADYLYGDELIRFVLRRYAQGNLGLKTLARSLKAWLWYKFKRKKSGV